MTDKNLRVARLIKHFFSNMMISRVRSLTAFCLCVLLNVSFSALATESPADQTERAGQAAPVIDDLYVSFQIYAVDEDSASAYFDIHPYYKEPLSITEANTLANAIAGNLTDMLPFFTDATPSQIEILIIRITNMDEYNEGSGYDKVATVSMRFVNEQWSVTCVDFE